MSVERRRDHVDAPRDVIQIVHVHYPDQAGTPGLADITASAQRLALKLSAMVAALQGVAALYPPKGDSHGT